MKRDTGIEEVKEKGRKSQARGGSVDIFILQGKK